MNAHTRVSAKGQIVIPKGLRDRLAWAPGTELEIEESGNGLTLRPVEDASRRISYEEFTRRMPRYDGPPASLEDMNDAILGEAARRWKDFERRNP